MEEGRKNSGKVLFNRSGSEIFGVTRARPGAGRYSDVQGRRQNRRSGHLVGVDMLRGYHEMVLSGSEGPRCLGRIFGVFVEDAKDAADMGVEAAVHGRGLAVASRC